MSSGVAVSDECKIKFEDIKKHQRHRFVVFHIKDDKCIAVETLGEPGSSYEDFLSALQKEGPTECRYGIYDFEYMHQGQGTEAISKKKLVLMIWCPENAKVKKKMLYSSSFDALKRALVGIHKYIQATDISEASEETVEKQLRAMDRN